MRTIRMTVQYDGTDFAGFQVQSGRRTVQGELEDALDRVTGAPTRIVGAGRTDAGVHAAGQVISFVTQSILEPVTLRRAANAVLPEDVAILDAAEATMGFNARYSARSRAYRYTVWNAEIRSAPDHRYTHHWRHFLDVESMDEAVQRLVGRHDFAAFSTASHGRERPQSTERSLYRAHWWREGARVCLEVVADAFLPHMVRNLVGTLLLVGMHQATPDKMVEILASGDRRRAGVTAPAKGLCLTHVQYV